MAKLKITFTIPKPLAAEFFAAIPSGLRSGFVAEAIRKSLYERERALMAASTALSVYGGTDRSGNEEHLVEDEPEIAPDVLAVKGVVAVKTVVPPTQPPKIEDEELNSFEDILRVLRGMGGNDQ